MVKPRPPNNVEELKMDFNKNPLNRITTIAIGLVAVASFSLAGCSKKPEEKHAVANYNPATKYVVAKKSINSSKAVTAFYTTTDAAVLRARIGGTLVRLMVDEGDYISQGQTLALIDEERYRAEVAAGQANAAAMQSAASASVANSRAAPAQLAVARANAALAQSDYSRTKSLFDQGVYAQARLDQVNAALNVANAQVATAQAGVAAANASASAARAQAQSARAGAAIAQAVRAQGRIVAPRSGRVITAPIPQGSVVMPGEVVVAIAAGQQMVRFMAAERDAVQYRVGQSIRIADNEGKIIGYTRIAKIYPNAQNGQIQIDAESDGTEHFDGERVNLRVATGQRDAIIIPSNYIILRQSNAYVRLLRGGSVLEIPIQRGQNVDGSNIPNAVEVQSGLNVGDTLVTPIEAPPPRITGKRH